MEEGSHDELIKKEKKYYRQNNFKNMSYSTPVSDCSAFLHYLGSSDDRNRGKKYFFPDAGSC